MKLLLALIIEVEEEVGYELPGLTSIASMCEVADNCRTVKCKPSAIGTVLSSLGFRAGCPPQDGLPGASLHSLSAKRSDARSTKPTYENHRATV